MVKQADILDVLATINDPEMPISIVDLGIIERVTIDDAQAGTNRVTIDVLPTFVGCPALPVIESAIREELQKLPGVNSVDVRFKYSPPWTVDRISAAGRESLRHHGVTVPRLQCVEEAPTGEGPSCPFCGSPDVHLESAFGPTRCRMIYHCQSCKHPFEHLKRLALPMG